MPEPTSDASSAQTANAESCPPIELALLPDVAELLGVTIIDVHKLLKDGKLVAVTDEEGRKSIPRQFFDAGAIVKSLPAVITLLRDSRFSDAEIVDWLFRPDETLPGTPVEALRDNRGTEIKRRAQSAGY
jgi:hypothetical protein